MHFQQWSLRRRIMLVAALPTLAAIVILSSFYMFQRWQDVHAGQEALADLLLENLAAAAEYPLISGNYELLQPLIETALRQPDVIAVEIQAADGRQLLKTLDEQFPLVAAADIKVRSFEVYRDVWRLDEFSQFDDSNEQQTDQQRLATIHLSLTDTFTRERELSILWQAAVAGLMVVLIAALIGHFTAFDIIRSLEKLSAFIAQLARGDIEARIRVDDGAELGRLQKNANQLASSLEQAERDQQIYTDRLMAEQQKTQHASRAKSDFLAMMSHEFRTPLNGAIGMLQLLTPEVSQADFQEYKGMAEESLSHLTQLLEDVLIVVDTESNKLQVLHSEQQLDELLAGLLCRYQRLAADKQLQLKVHYDELLTQQAVLTDPALVRQIVRHLMDNAFKFTQQGSIQLDLLLQQFDGEQRLCVVVSDTGIGIADEDKQRVLEAFSQISSSFNRRYDGIGLGLTISSHISRLLGGRLSLENTSSGGTRVKVEFPVALAESCCQDELPQGQKVLIVEDNPVNMKVAEKMLQKSFAGLQVDTVQSGEACLQQLQQQSYDLILMDCQMPGLDGFETTRQLRQQGNTVPVVACTANTSDQVYQQCRESGMNDYLAKPLKVDTIRKTLQRWLVAVS